MNRHYSLVWNRALCVLQVVSELARPAARGDGALRDARAPCVHRLAAACLLGLCATHAAPTWAAQDFTIAPANGDITGAALGASLDAGNVTILSSSGASLGTGNVNVYDNVSSVSANTLTLTAARDINLTGGFFLNTEALVLNPATANGPDAAVPGGAIFAGTTVHTGFGQAWNGAVKLVNSLSAYSSSGAIDFATTVDGGYALAVNTSGVTTFGGAVGGTTALASLTTDAGGSTALGGNVTTTGAQTYNDAVTLAGDVTAASTGSGNIDFGSTVDGPYNLTVMTGGTTIFGGAVGGTTTLTSLTTDAGGSTTLGGNATTTGAQTYNDAVTLAGDVTAASTGNGNIDFASTVDGTHGLVVNTGGAVSFGGAIGGSTLLAGLTTNSGTFSAGSTLNVGSLSITTTGGGIAQSGSWTVSGPSDFNAGSNPITLANAGNDFTGTVNLVGGTAQITDAKALTLGTASAASLNVDAFSGITLTQNVNIAGALQLTSTGGAITEAAAGAITAGTLTGNSAGSTKLNGANVVGALGAFTTGGDFSFNNAHTLTVNNAPLANGGAGNLTLTTTGASSDLILATNLIGNTVTLGAGRNIGQIGGVITATTLAGSSTGSTMLTSANLIGTLGNFTAANFALTNAQALTVSGSVNGGTSTTLTTITSDLAIYGAVSGTLTTLTSAGAITEGAAGVITAGTLTGSSVGSTTLTGANLIGTLGNFTAANFALTNAQALAVSGPVNGGTSTTLTTITGDLAINGAVNGTTTALTSAGAITEGAGGVITAGTLTGSSVGSTTLNGANHVGALGTFTTGGDFAFNDAQTLTVVNAPSANGGAGNLTLTTTGASSDLILATNLIGNTVTLGAGRNISQIGGAITATTLAGGSTGSTMLTGANLIGTLGNFTAANFALTNAQALTVSGSVNGGTSTTLTTTSGNLTIAGAVGASGNVSLNANGALDITGGVDGGTVNLSAGGNTLLTGSLGSTSGTTLGLGTLQVGNGSTTGSLVGNVVDNTGLIFDRSDTVTFAGAISGAGSLTQAGSGALTLDGNSSGFSGNTTVQAGSLIVGGVAGNGAALGGNVTVDSGATLGGHGTIGGNVDVLAGGIVAPGNSIGTLTVNGDFTVAQGSVLDYEFGAPAASPNAFITFGAGDSVHVGGNLELDGATLNATDTGGMGPGLYNLFTYGGTLTETNGGFALNNTTGQTLQVQSLTAQKQINLIDATGFALDFWNANGQASATQMGGGSGTWSATSQEWTDATGSVPNLAMQPQPGFAIFGGAPGTVTVDGSSGNVTATGMQFAVDGYTLTGGTLTLVGSGGAAPVIRVGDGSSAGAAMTATIDDVLAGSDGLAKTDAGALVLTGANTFTGGVAIDGGTLAVSSDANLGAGANTLTLDGGTLEVTGTAFTQTTRTITLGNAGGGFDIDAAGNTFTLAQPLTGLGSLGKTGSGTLALTGANTFTGGTTISAGTLQVGNGGTSGSIVGDVTDNGALVFDHSDGVDFAGAISGSGSLAQAGSGALTLNGNSSAFTGTTNVSNGTLVVGDDSHAGAALGGVVNVASGAMLGGIGTLGGLDLAGTLSPGGSIGTLHVSGDATFEQGSTFNVEASPDGKADLLAVAGGVSIKGGSVIAIAQAGNWAPQTVYTIITAGKGVTGTFGSVSDNLAFLTPVLAYSANAVDLSLQRNDVGFGSIAVTPNEKGAATGAGGLGFGNPLYDALVKLDTTTAPIAFQQLSGEYHASQQTARIDDSRYVREAMDQRLRDGDNNPGAAKAGGDTKLTAWAHAWGHWGTTDSDGNAGRLADNGDGLLVGADLPVGAQGRIGIIGGASRNSLSVGSRASWGRLTSQWLGAFGGVDINAFALRGGVAYAWDEVPTRREVAFPGYTDRLSDNASGNTLTGFVEGAWRFGLARGDLEPFVNLAHTRVETDASAEAGGAAALKISEGSANVSFATVGVRGSIAIAHHLDLHGELGWQHAFGDTTPGRTLQFVAGGPAFTEYGVPIAKNAGIGKIGIGWHAGRVAIDADYEGLSGGGVQDQAAKLSVSVAF